MATGLKSESRVVHVNPARDISPTASLYYEFVIQMQTAHAVGSARPRLREPLSPRTCVHIPGLRHAGGYRCPARSRRQIVAKR